MAIARGSPPHTRDKSLRCCTTSPSPGITPAYAGQIQSTNGKLHCTRDHPRIRGTNCCRMILSGSCLGSPPHTRDKFSSPCGSVPSTGITPAYAGQISDINWTPTFVKDHPRIRGTNGCSWGAKAVDVGSPPHTRDKCVPIAGVPIASGITPAYAGQIACRVRRALTGWDHPRIRGTNT